MNWKELLNITDIVDVLGEYIDLKPGSGQNYKAYCPFHAENNPSFHINTELQIFKCFSCGRGGNSLKFLQEFLSLSFEDACHTLSTIAGVEDEQMSKRIASKKELVSILSQILLQYNSTLLEEPVAIKYLKSRGISKNTAMAYQLGFAPNNYQNLVEGDLDKRLLRELGMIVDKGTNLVDYFVNRIILPYFDETSDVIGFMGRVIGGEQFAKYLNSKNSSIFSKHDVLYGLNVALPEIRKTQTIVLVEGQFDVISLYEKGWKNVVGISGSNLTQIQIDKFKTLVDYVYIFADGDEPGREAVFKFSKRLMKNDLIPKIIFQEGLDPDEFIQKYPFILKELEALPLSQFLFQEGEYIAMTKVIQLARNINDKVKLAFFINEISQYSSFEIPRIEKMIKSSTNHLGEVYKPRNEGSIPKNPNEFFTMVKEKRQEKDKKSQLKHLKDKFNNSKDPLILQQIQNLIIEIRDEKKN